MPRARANKKIITTTTTESTSSSSSSSSASSWYAGPWWAIEADALFRKGRVDLGKYTEPEVKKGALERRLADLKAQGYTNIEVKEIPGE